MHQEDRRRSKLCTTVVLAAAQHGNILSFKVSVGWGKAVMITMRLMQRESKWVTAQQTKVRCTNGMHSGNKKWKELSYVAA